MLDSKGFDAWAARYDLSVRQSDEESSYPFAGYAKVLRRIAETVLCKDHPAVLDLGFGTGTLAELLYEQGCRICGQDFSKEMVKTVQNRIPDGVFVQQDFQSGIHEELKKNAYDFIVCTYAIHHLNDEEKAVFIQRMLEVLKIDGEILIGDVAFENRAELEECRLTYKDTWDPDEIYCVYQELKNIFPAMEFEKISFCAGILSLKK